ncbi:unnamed protein product, partial [Rotaria magnacalcarata]
MGLQPLLLQLLRLQQQQRPRLGLQLQLLRLQQQQRQQLGQ